MQKLVVKAVKALSALEKADEMMPMEKNIKTLSPTPSLDMKSGNNESPFVGKAMPFELKYIIINTPNAKNRKLTGKNTNP